MICSYRRYGLSLWVNMCAPKYLEWCFGKKGKIEVVSVTKK